MSRVQNWTLAILFVLWIGCPLAFGAAGAVSAVTDAAGYGPRVSPGSLATIFGTNLASSTGSASAFPLPTSLGGATVEINTALVPLLYASAGQINFQVPSALTAGTASLIVHAPGGDSASFSFTVAAQTPSMFQYGTNHAVAQNGDALHSLNSDSTPAAAGSIITVYLTGQGPLDNPVADGAPAQSSPLSQATATATATIGIQNAPVKFLGLTPGFAGLAQANIQVPTLPSGDYPLVLTVGGTVSVSTILSVAGSGTGFTSPMVLVGQAAFANSMTSSVQLLGTTAYVCGANRITMLDVSNVQSPTVVGEFGDSTLNGYGTICTLNASVSPPYLVDVVGPLTDSTVTMGPSFAVYDLTNPRIPVLLGVTQTQNPYIVDLSFVGNYGFCSTSYFTFLETNMDITAQTGDFLAFDFTNPGTPQALSELSTLANTSLMPAAAAVDSNYAFIASSTATGNVTTGNGVTGVLDVIQIAVPSSLTSVIQIPVTQASILLSFDVAGNLLLVSGNTTGNRNPGTPDFGFTGDLTITTMDITNPADPVVTASIDSGIQVNGTFHTAAFSNGVFVIVNNPPITDTAGPASLMVVDARQPASPVLYPFQTQFGFSGMVPTSTGYLLASTSLGLSIYQLQYR